MKCITKLLSVLLALCSGSFAIVPIICDPSCSPDPSSPSSYAVVVADRPVCRNVRGRSVGDCPIDGGPGDTSNALGSGSYTYSVPILHLPGRNGLNLNLNLVYNSAVWSLDIPNQLATFNPDRDFPGYGFRLDFGFLEYDTGGHVYVLTGADGSKHRLRFSVSPNYTSDDSTYIQYNTTTHVLTYKNGTQVTYAKWTGTSYANLWNPIQIQDTNGNRISIAYNANNHITSITDTLGRIITFTYNTSGFLTSITQGTKTYATLNWGSVPLNYNFAGYAVSAPGNTTGSSASNGSTITVLSSCTYANSVSYQFSYGDWGIINKIQKTSAAGTPRSSISYNFPLVSAGALLDAPTYTQQTVFDGVNTTNFTYAITKNAAGIVNSYVATDPSGTKSTATISAKGDWMDGLVLSVLTQSGATSLRQIDNVWTSDATTHLNPRLGSVTTTLKDTGKQSQVQYVSYDPSGNVTQVNELDWGLALTRYTTFQYASIANHILDRRSQVKVFDANNHLTAEADYGYDSYPSGITSVTGASGHDDVNYSSSFTARGNLTSITRYPTVSPVSGGITQTLSYDSLGNVLSALADCCTQLGFGFTSTTQYAYPETMTRGPASLQLSTTATYDNVTGHMTSSTDENGQVTYFHFVDPIDRLTQVDRPDPTATRVQVNTSYDDTSALASVSTSNTANSRVDKTTFDGSGRVLHSYVKNGSATVTTVDTSYNDGARTVQTSNPYGPSETPNNSTVQFDPLGRPLSAAAPSGGSTGYGYSRNTLTLTDPTGKQRKTYSDAFGRIIQVDEPGYTPPTKASGSITVGGAEQTRLAPGATAATGSVTLNGSYLGGKDGKGLANPDCTTNCVFVYDSGTVTITLNGTNYAFNYGQSSTVNGIAASLASMISGGPWASATVTNVSLKQSVIHLTTQPGPGTNYPLSAACVTNDDNDFPAGSFSSTTSGATLTGGSGTTVYDTGSVTVTVNGFPASSNYQNGSSAASVAADLASKLNGSGSPVTAANSPGSPVLTVTSIAAGSASNYTLTTSAASSNGFAASSFSASLPAGNILTGGHGPGTVPSLSTPNSTLYSYDVLNDLLTVMQNSQVALSQTRSFAYDSMGRMTSQTLPESGTLNLAYLNSSGAACSTNPSLVCQRTEVARGYTTTYTYDALNRLTFRSNSGGPTKTFNYDEGGAAANALGHLTSAGDPGPFPSQFESYSYDILGRIKQDSLGGVSGFSASTQYSYTPAGDLLTITYPSGRQVTQGYDSIGRLNQVSSQGTTYLSIPAGNGYSGAGEVLNATYGSGVSGVFGYNDHLQLHTLQYLKASTTLLNLTYNYNDASGRNNGQIQGITDGRGNAFSTSYSYDAWSRLSAAQTVDLTSANTWALAWDYDSYGNRLNQRLTGGTAAVTQPQLSIDPTTNRITTTGYSYLDSNTGTVAGNLSSDSIHSYTYDPENRLQTVDQTLAGYNYDQNGRRYFRSTTANGVTTNTNYVFSGSKVIAEYVGGALSKEYIYAGSGLLATLTTNGSTVTATYSYPDHLSTRVETDASGNITRTYGHLPYGDTWYETGPSDKWKFTSYERDSEDQLDYAMARFYSSRLGRFMSADPLGQGYPYVANDPINGVDPLGLFHCPSHYANQDYTFWCAGQSGNGPACPYCGSPTGGNPSYSGDTPGQIGTPLTRNEAEEINRWYQAEVDCGSNSGSCNAQQNAKADITVYCAGEDTSNYSCLVPQTPITEGGFYHYGWSATAAMFGQVYRSAAGPVYVYGGATLAFLNAADPLAGSLQSISSTRVLLMDNVISKTDLFHAFPSEFGYDLVTNGNILVRNGNYIEYGAPGTYFGTQGTYQVGGFWSNFNNTFYATHWFFKPGP